MRTNELIHKQQRAAQRKRRVRSTIQGTAQRPRVSVYRSLRTIYVQVIDDSRGHTIVAASTKEVAAKGKDKQGGKVAAAKAVGLLIAERAKEHKITQVVFDRGRNLYHGRIQAVAEGLREGGLEV